MNIDKINKQFKNLFENNIISEEHAGKTFISIDIQPEYESYFGFEAFNFCEYLNDNSSNFDKLIFLYNGQDTLDMISESEYQNWLLDNGLHEDVLSNIGFYDKGYAFFRSCMDTGIYYEEIVHLVQYMYNNNIHDSRDVDEEMWNTFMQKYDYGDSEIRELLEYGDETLYIPELMGFLNNYNNIVITGGAMEQCLKEVEIALDALGKPYNIEQKFTYH